MNEEEGVREVEACEESVADKAKATHTSIIRLCFKSRPVSLEPQNHPTSRFIVLVNEVSID